MSSQTEGRAASARTTFNTNNRKPRNKIALEEAVASRVFDATNTLPPMALAAELPYVDPQYGKDVHHRLLDVESRVEAMDQAGVALTVVSLTMPGIEGIFDADTAVEMATKINTEIYDTYTNGKFAARFRAFGCVPMQSPEAAACEAERCLRELGFAGILINGFTNIGGPDTVQYLDEPVCEPFGAKMEELDAPVYIHPRIPPPGQMRGYQGCEFLGGSP